ncbi:indole-3-glycerol phosphate synthase TrpC [Alkalitalea saponilacus]|uniref:indole-3-glycerol-phosphate synthase n=1 Tax=Alkalitalea saponilacus TaxID=889453 RepID=A0A1T5HT33_9BACT|nr:indole-3-glycerol phosphate synthase TrpC [Alkalitalea saponilacus]ASB48544.1 indole-3-glycerol phosphate synthase [Alkalitalea saponilacus]SKC23827.1 indole-3-glycerol phosphate synthase [Alkalitalea saponilacus]
MNILDKIVARKKEEVAAAQDKVSVKELKYYRHYNEQVSLFTEHLLAENSTGIISEFKRKSPSKGDINGKAVVDEIIPGYAAAGVSGISILTDHDFFGGCNEDLTRGRELCKLPIIRKEFIIDPYQVYEAKAIGASAILLIGAILDKTEALELAALANALGMQVLFEIHDEKELELLNSYVQMVGINNRNLKTFKVDLEQSIRLASKLPKEMIPIAESGIGSVDDYLKLKNAGFKGFLMGEYFMKQSDPAGACLEFSQEVKQRTIKSV